jgi:hypothetical protein
MKRIILASLSVLSLSSLLSTAAIATEQPQSQKTAIVMSSKRPAQLQIAPNTLVSLAYQGYFREQGIPGYGGLSNAYTAGRVDAKGLIQSAIEIGKASPEVLMDSGYINIVESGLMGLSN